MTQFEHLGAVPNITERFLIPLLEGLITSFPFVIRAFHADSEYLRAGFLAKLHVGTFTKSRPKRSHDNALVEGKNGSMVRRWLGHIFVPDSLTHLVDAFLREELSPLLNFHRPCLFAVEEISETGRVKKRYPQAQVATPYDRFRGLPDAERFLGPGITFEQLDRIAMRTGGLRAAERVRRARGTLLRTLAREEEAHRAA